MTTETPPPKTVILVDDSLPLGLAVNAAAIAAAMIVHAHPEVMGDEVGSVDVVLAPVVFAPLPVLAADASRLSEVWQAAREKSDSGLDVFPFTSLAQSCKTYDEYVAKAAAAPLSRLRLSALGLAGPKKIVNGLCGDMPLYPRRVKTDEA